MKKRFAVLMMCILAAVCVAGVCVAGENESKRKVAIILLAGNETNEGMARAVHAMLYARQLADHACQVALIFDGAGAGWAAEMNKPGNPLHKHYLEVRKRGIVMEICDYCVEQRRIRGDMSEVQRKLLTGDYEGHPDIAKWMSLGYEVIVI